MSANDLCQKALTVLDAGLPIQPGSAIHRMIRQHFDIKRSTVLNKRGEILELLAKAGDPAYAGYSCEWRVPA